MRGVVWEGVRGEVGHSCGVEWGGGEKGRPLLQSPRCHTLRAFSAFSFSSRIGLRALYTFSPGAAFVSPHLHTENGREGGAEGHHRGAACVSPHLHTEGGERQDDGQGDAGSEK